MRTILNNKELFRWTKAKDIKPKTYGYTINGSKTVELQNPSGYSIYNFLIDGASHKDIYVNYLHEGLYELNFFLEKGTDINIRSGQRLNEEKQLHVVSTVFHKPETSCTQDFRFVVDDKAVSSFKGVIVIDAESKKVESYMNNKNLLLSRTAKAFSKPQLNIENNDVACSHGSSTGALDKEQMFYLQSRGLSKSDAKTLLVNAFINEVTPNDDE
tara:strand:- start:200 stop:841 length:642 start_codon:yes stop_codon:yes gene_type:complete